ncbi:hypothetical protein [Sphaerisporangium corydalis]|uniref:Galactose oxidase n=1 Tax=Sphaerisporangium corydalis TaxID=1441875 RepID=A0ABV9EAY1_9ACTN|nr:hypothetical protein [Sphaerisporangium corydalis]
MGTTPRWPIAITCLVLVTSCGGAPGGPPARPSPGSPAATPGAAASPAATGEIASSPAWKAVKAARLDDSAALLDVASTGPRDAWAVGYEASAEDTEGAPAVQHWDGTRWTEKRVPASSAWHLVGVSADGPDDAWVVGNAESPYAAHWNGRTWTGFHPFGVADDYALTGVATTGGHAWLVGRNASQGMITEWRGGGFRNALRADGYFTAVTAGRGHVWAVGTDAPAGSGKRGTPMIWHGSAVSGPDVQSWERGRTPEIAGGVLRKVWMVSPSDVWAVGGVTASGDSAEAPLVLHWDGAAWRRVPVPVPRGRLDGLTALAADDVWVSGVDADHSGQVLFLHYDGQGFTPSYGPLLRREEEGQQYPESDDIGRTGIARVPGTSRLWAVGSVGWGDAEAPFVLRHD